LRQSDDPESLINKLYDDNSICGRRGVLPLADAFAIVKKKVQDRAKRQQFVDKFGRGE